MSTTAAFSPDYATARLRFRQAASRLGWRLEAYPVGGTGPHGDELTIDIGCSPAGDPATTLVLSSGVHGVEGFFGSAVQLALLEHWATSAPPPARCVFLHGLNPYGFAWLRRCDENNVDPNRNFLLPGERYDGAPPGYADLDAFLNPRRPPSRWEPFTLKALWLIARHGMSFLRQAVAAGQYQFPRGLFFGGDGPSRMNLLLADHLGRWLAGSRRVIHLDFHTGLGRSGEGRLLIDHPLDAGQCARLARWFGAGAFEGLNTSTTAYDAKGGFGRWCLSRGLATDYVFACAEFGTFSPILMLAALRAENQAHHWGTPTAAPTRWAKGLLVERFCPAAAAWRSRVLAGAAGMVDRAVRALAE